MDATRRAELQMEGAGHSDLSLVQSHHFTACGRMTWGELRQLLDADERVEKALKRIAASPNADDPEEMGECISDVDVILRGSHD